MKIVTIIGARPQFIKAAPVSRALRKDNTEILVHTGQHYDHNMSEIFFDELNIPKPDYNLEVGSGNHGKQTGEMLAKIEEVLLKEKPDWVLIYGDTNSTVAGSLAAAKLHIPVAHVEAGLRSFNRKMPEEINRVVADHLSTLLFPPTETAVNHLRNEGITKNVYNVGDVMLDATLYNLKIAEEKSTILDTLNLKPDDFFLATVHRAENTDIKENLENIFTAFSKTKKKVILPLHPRTTNKLKSYGLTSLLTHKNIQVVEPIGYLDMIMLEKHATKILTDSGGVQKEAYFMKTPCITLRTETEWVETVESGWNVIVNTDVDKILEYATKDTIPNSHPDFYGDGMASEKIAERLKLCAV